jgi:eukaryotic-like serine/threonine-protein kinase
MKRVSRVEEDGLLGGRYRLTSRMAAGGMGQVWQAEDTVLHRPVAVKVLSEGLSSDPKSAERFRREARAAAGLSHPNVAGVFDYGEDDGTQFIVMELVEGETLAERIRREGRLDPDEAARVALGMVAALAAAHDAGVVHRDVKPGNVMLSPQGEVKVLDFGIAAASGPALTATGFTIGTAAYLSPEQASGDRAGPASDVYSLGVVLYEMLAGRPPFTGETPVAVVAAHVSKEPRPLTDVVPDVPPHLARACHRALAKDPALRPSAAAEFAQMLRSPDGEADRAGTFATEPAAAQPPSPDSTTALLPPADSTAALPGVEPGTGGSPVRKSRVPALPGLRANRAGWILGAVLVGLVLLAVVLWSALGGSSRPRRVTIPHVAGLKLGDAERKLQQAGLTVVGVKRVEGPVDTVVRTDPPEGASVAPGATVTLYAGAAPNEEEGQQGKGKGKGKGKGDGDGKGGD